MNASSQKNTQKTSSTNDTHTICTTNTTNTTSPAKCLSHQLWMFLARHHLLYPHGLSTSGALSSQQGSSQTVGDRSPAPRPGLLYTALTLSLSTSLSILSALPTLPTTTLSLSLNLSYHGVYYCPAISFRVERSMRTIRTGKFHLEQWNAFLPPNIVGSRIQEHKAMQKS